MGTFDIGTLAPNVSSGKAQADLVKYYKTYKTNNPMNMYNDAVENLGIPEARTTVANDRKAINDTQNLINAVDPSVTGRTQGALVTDAQRQGLIAKEKTPLMAGLSNLSGIYGTSSANLADLMGQADQQTMYGMQGQQDVLSALLQRLQYGQNVDALNASKAAAAASNAWQTALQNALTANDERSSWIDEQINKTNDLSVSSLSSPLNVKYNYGMQGSTYNPQNTYNPQKATGGLQKTGNPQKAYGGDINKLKTNNLQVKTTPKSKKKVVVTNKKKNRTVVVNGGNQAPAWSF